MQVEYTLLEGPKGHQALWVTARGGGPVKGDPLQNGSRGVKLAAKQAAISARAALRALNQAQQQQGDLSTDGSAASSVASTRPFLGRTAAAHIAGMALTAIVPATVRLFSYWIPRSVGCVHAVAARHQRSSEPPAVGASLGPPARPGPAGPADPVQGRAEPAPPERPGTAAPVTRPCRRAGAVA